MKSQEIKKEKAKIKQYLAQFPKIIKRILLKNKKFFLFFLFFLSLFNSLLAFNLQIGFKDKLEGTNLYFTNQAKAIYNITLEDNETVKVYLNNNLIKTITNNESNQIINLPEGQFTLNFTSNKTTKSFSYKAIKLSVQDLTISILNQELTEQEEVKLKVLVSNDNTEDDLTLKVKIFDEDNNLVKEKEFNFFLDKDLTTSKYLSFTPLKAGIYKIKAELYSKELKIKEIEKEIKIEVSKPDITFTLNKDNILIGDSLIAQVNLQNGPIERNYKIKLFIYAPDGSTIYNKKETINLQANSIRTIIFPVDIQEDWPSGNYLALVRIEFQANNKTYTLEEQKSFNVISSAPELTINLITPKEAINDKKFIYVIQVKHQSSKSYEYAYQCFFYDENQVLLKTSPSTPSRIYLNANDFKTIKQEITIPSNWKSGNYYLECIFKNKGKTWKDKKEFIVKTPRDYYNLFIIPKLNENNEITTKVCFSTKAIEEIPSSLLVNYYYQGNIINVFGPIEVKLKNKVSCIENKYKIPNFVDKKELTIEASLILDNSLELKKETTLNKPLEISLECDKKLTTPLDDQITCSLITNEEGQAIVGLANREAIINPIFDEKLKEAFFNSKIINVSKIATFQLKTNIPYKKAKVIAIFKDKEGFVYTSEFNLTIIPKVAEIKTAQTFSDLKYNNKPIIEKDSIFSQDVVICSKSNENVKIKVEAEPDNEMAIIPLDNVKRLELAPKQCLTTSFLFKGGKYLTAKQYNINYNIYLEEDNQSYLISSKSIKAIATKEYYQQKEPKKEINLLPLIIIIVVLIIIGIILYIILRKKRKVVEVNANQGGLQ